MPTVMIAIDDETAVAGAFQLKERVRARDLRDEHFGAQLLERMRWALEDAERAERRTAE
jgi:hypothetical protein